MSLRQRDVLQTTRCLDCGVHGIGTTAGMIYTRSGSIDCFNGKPHRNTETVEWVPKPLADAMSSAIENLKGQPPDSLLNAAIHYDDATR